MSSRWMSKPPVGSVIDWGNPLAKGLVGAWLMNEGGGKKTRELVNSEYPAEWVGDTVWTPSSKGSSLKFDGSGDYITFNSKPYNNPNKYISIECMVRSRAGGSFDYYIAKGKDVQYQLDTGAAATSTRFVLFDNTPTAFINFTVTNVLPNNVWVHVVATFDGTRGVLYKNSRQVGQQVASGSGTLQNVTDTLRFGSSGTSDFWAGDINFVRIYNRALSPSEIQSLYESPYQFIKGPSTITYFTPPQATGWTWGGEVKNVMVA